jgi:hypothetical protein
VVAVTVAMAMARQEGREIVIDMVNRAIGPVNVTISNQRRRRRPIRPKKKSKVCCLLRLTLSRGQLVGGGCEHQTKGVRAQVPDPVGVGIPDAAPVGKAAVGGEQEIIVGMSGGGQELVHLVEQKV